MYKIILSLQISLLTLFSSTQAQVTEKPMSTLININKMVMWVRADGYSAHNPYSHNKQALQWGLLYPRGVPVGLVWADGLVWGGMVADGREPIIRVGGTNWASGLQPGAFTDIGQAEDPADPQVNHVWRYRPDWQTANLTDEARDLLSFRPDTDSLNFQFPPEELQRFADSLRTAYAQDLATWPWQKGAPFYDDNRNGVMDAGEQPGLLDADQIVWLVANDLDSTKTLALHGSPPIGIELQITLWAYRDDPNLENTILRRNRIIYRGTDTTPRGAHIDSMGFSVYSEEDLGTFSDDMLATDTTLQMVYTYNSVTQDPAYTTYLSSVPAVCYQLLQGPLVKSSVPDNAGTFDFQQKPGYRNLPMTGSLLNKAGDSIGNPSNGPGYDGTLMYYNIINGFLPRPWYIADPIFDPVTQKPTTFMYTGDPIAQTGWLDSWGSNAQSDMTTSGFNLALGDTQEVIFAVTAGLGANRLASIQVMNFFARKVREYVSYGYQPMKVEQNMYETPLPETFHLLQNYPNPFNPATTIRYELPVSRKVTLSIYNLLGQKIRTLVNRTQEAGSYSVVWDGTNNEGKRVPSGIYVYRLDSGIFRESRKMVLVR